jgi:hypothetical protein
MSGSALSGIVSSDPLWNINGIREDEEDEEPELPQLYFHYAGESGTKKDDQVTVKQELEDKQDRRQSREREDKENNKHERIPSAGIGMGRPRGLPRSFSNASDTQTPPQVSSGFSTHSSASSARIGSLTDASTVSQSSMEPTPPSAYGGHMSRSSLSSNASGSGSGSGSGGSGDRPLGRTYGGSSARTFSRHVSAPLGRNWPAREDKSRDKDTEEVCPSFLTCSS